MRYLDTAFAHLSFAIKLMQAAENGVIDLESIDTPASRRRPLARDSLAVVVSVVVSIQMRKMFAEMCKMFVNVRHAEQDVRKRQARRTSEPNSCSYEAA